MKNIRIQDMPQSTEDEINHKNNVIERAKSLGLAKLMLEVTEQDVLDAESGKAPKKVEAKKVEPKKVEPKKVAPKKHLKKPLFRRKK